MFRLDQRHGTISVVDWIGDTPLVRVVNADPVSGLPRFAGEVADEC